MIKDSRNVDKIFTKLSRGAGDIDEIWIEIDNYLETDNDDLKETDISLFYFAGHGADPLEDDISVTGTLMGTTNYCTLLRLKEELDKVRGRKIVILDSCHSGHFINLIQNADNCDEYYVFTACAAEELSLHDDQCGHLFTKKFCQGLASNNTTAISINTAYQIVRDNVHYAYNNENPWSQIINQLLRKEPHLQAWQSDCGWFKPFRPAEFR